MVGFLSSMEYVLVSFKLFKKSGETGKKVYFSLKAVQKVSFILFRKSCEWNNHFYSIKSNIIFSTASLLLSFLCNSFQSNYPCLPLDRKSTKDNYFIPWVLHYAWANYPTLFQSQESWPSRAGTISLESWFLGNISLLSVHAQNYKILEFSICVILQV